MVWVEEYSADCSDCRKLYAQRTPPEEPPCDTCRVEAHEENRDAIRIFVLVKYQLIMGSNGPVAISQSAIHEAMTLYEIENRKECFEKLLTLGAWWIDRLRDNENH